MNNDFQQIKDPVWVKQSEEYVNRFLSEKNLPYRLDVQASCATTTSFQSVMLCCIQLIDANSVVEDFKKEVPKILEKLGYPYNLRTGKWAACTTPHNWPKLLFVLRWVVELCHIMDVCKQDKWDVPENPDSCVALDKELEFYFDWRDKKCNMEDILEKFTEEINEESGKEITEYKKLLDEVERDRVVLVETLKRKEAQKEKIVQLENSKRMISQMQSTIRDLEEKSADLQNNIDCQIIKQQGLDKQQAALESNLKEVQRQIDEQPMTSEEVKNMKTRLNDLTERQEENLLGIVYHERQNKDLSENVLTQYTSHLVPYMNKFNQLAKELNFSSKAEGGAVFEIDAPQFDDFLNNGIHIGNAKTVPNTLEKQIAGCQREELELKKNMEELKLKNHDLKNQLDVLKNSQNLLEKNILDHHNERKEMRIRNQEELNSLRNLCNKKSSENENQRQAIKYEAEAKDKELQSLITERNDMQREREDFLQKQQNEINPQIYEFMNLMKTMDDSLDEEIAAAESHLADLTSGGDNSESPI